MYKLFYLFFLLLTALQLTAQDSLAKYSAVELGKKSSMAAENGADPKLWKIYLDGMLRKNPTDSLKSNTFYDLAWQVYKNQDCDLNVPIDILKQGLESAKRAKSMTLTLNCLESLSTFYALKNENEKALKCFEEMKKICQNIPKESPLYVTFQASTARVYSIIGDFKRSIFIVKKSNTDINKYIAKHPKLPKDSLDELIWIEEGNYIHLAQSYNFQKQLDSAAFCIKKAKQFEKKRSEKKWQHNIWVQEAFYLLLSKKYDQTVFVINEAEKKGYIDSKNKQYRSLYYLAAAAYGKEEYTKSLAFCEKALSINVKIASFMNFELEVYNLAMQNAEKLHDAKKEIYYFKKYNTTVQKYNYAEKSRFIANLYGQDVVAINEQLKTEKADKSIFILLLALFILISCYLFWHYVKQKKDRKNFEALILAFENNELENVLNESRKDENISPISQMANADKKISNISSEVEDRIIKQLDKFEIKERFLSQNISLSNVASDFNTNSAYISAVIKKHKAKNFSSYINKLRIEYIIKKLKTSQEHLNYKIAYLAEECGFSSHTVFIRIFTEYTDLTPSKFIDFLKNEE